MNDIERHDMFEYEESKELKTLKDIGDYTENSPEYTLFKETIFRELKQEAIKWIKEKSIEIPNDDGIYDGDEAIKTEDILKFLNITEENL